MSKVLIVEDDQFISKIMKFSLEESGYKVDHAENGVQALEKIGLDEYSVILLDLMMPEKDGFEVLEELKSKGIAVPTVVFSNLSQPDDKKRAIDLGAKEYFVKSDMAIDELTETVKKYLQ